MKLRIISTLRTELGNSVQNRNVNHYTVMFGHIQLSVYCTSLDILTHI